MQILLLLDEGILNSAGVMTLVKVDKSITEIQNYFFKEQYIIEIETYHWNFQNRSYCRWEWEWNHQLEPGGRNTECIQKPWTQVQPLIQAGPSPSFAGRYFQKTRGTVETSWHFCKNYIGIKIQLKIVSKNVKLPALKDWWRNGEG